MIQHPKRNTRPKGCNQIEPQKHGTSCCTGTSGPFKAFAIKSLTAAPLLVSAHIP